MYHTSMTLLSFICLSEHVFSELITTPVNTVIMSGSKVQMSCATNLGSGVIEWTVVKTGKVINERLRAVSSDNGSYYLLTLKDPPGQVDVVINEVQSTDAGLYTCREKKHGRGASAALVVLDSTPICVPDKFSSKQEDFSSDSLRSIGISETPKCSVSYSGDLSPIFRWHNRNTREINQKKAYTTKNNTDVKIVSSLIKSESPSIMIDLACFITFSQPNMSDETANTLMASAPPTYEFRWFASGTNPTSTLSPLPESTRVSQLSSQFLSSEFSSPPLKVSEFDEFTFQTQTTTRKNITVEKLFTENFIRNSEKSINLETTSYNSNVTALSVNIEAALYTAADSMYGLIAAIAISCVLLLICVIGASFYLVRNRRTIFQTVRANPNSMDFAEIQDASFGQLAHSTCLHPRIDCDSREEIDLSDNLVVKPETTLGEAEEDTKIKEVMNGLERHDYEEIEHAFCSGNTILKTVCTEPEGGCTPTLPPERKYLSLKTYSQSMIFDKTIEPDAKPKGYSTWKSTIPAAGISYDTVCASVHLNMPKDVASHSVDMEALD